MVSSTLSYSFLLPAPLLGQSLLCVLSCPSTASTCITHEIEKGFLLSPIREPIVADDDSKTGSKSGRNKIVADRDANEGTYVWQCSLLHRYCGGLHVRSNPRYVRIVGRKQKFCHVEKMSCGDMLICHVTDLRKVSAVFWVLCAEKYRVEVGRAAAFPHVHHLAKLVPSGLWCCLTKGPFRYQSSNVQCLVKPHVVIPRTVLGVKVAVAKVGGNAALIQVGVVDLLAKM